MTDKKMVLIELIEKLADSDLVHKMLAFAADRIMEVEVELRTAAAKGELAAARGAAQRLPGTGLGHLGGADRTGDPEAA